jgi:hypothetical protein
MAGWRDGGMAGWRDGGMAGWRDEGTTRTCLCCQNININIYTHIFKGRDLGNLIGSEVPGLRQYNPELSKDLSHVTSESECVYS